VRGQLPLLIIDRDEQCIDGLVKCIDGLVKCIDGLVKGIDGLGDAGPGAEPSAEGGAGG
jgi:hypothetical protein